jgi:hypothetical protein
LCALCALSLFVSATKMRAEKKQHPLLHFFLLCVNACL